MDEEEEQKKPRGGGRLLFAGLALLGVLALYVFRLADWQIANHQKWLNEADRSGSAKVTLDAARGEILDDKGNGLAINQTGYAIRFNAAYMTEETENKTIHTLISLLRSRGEEWVDKLPIRLSAAGKYEFIPGQEKEAAVLKSKDFLNVNPYATAEQCMQHLTEKYGCKGYSAKDARDIVSVRYNMDRSWFSISLPYTFAESVSQNTVAIVSENSPALPGVDIKVTAVRKYPDGSLLPHILGSVGAISKEEYDALHETKGYPLNARLGKSGIEKNYEDQLRGKDGELDVNLAPDGSVASEVVTKKPVPGNTVHLTVDSRLQKVLNASLAQNVQGAQAYGRQLCAQGYKGSSSGHGEDCVAGGAVVLRVKDFAILASSTYPSYDQNQYAKDPNYYKTLLNNKAKPLINRAFNGVFTPGSIVKPYVTLAALQEGAITTSTRILANSVYRRFADSGFTPHSIGNYGYVTANFALMKSSNAFFYEVGYRLGITKMNLYAKRFGLGVKTGVELGESAGTLAGPAERSAAGGSWWDGNTVEAAVGQDDNLFSPLQLATYCATLANKGTRLQPHIVDKITDYTQKKTLYATKPKKAADIGVSSSYQEYVKDAMHSVTKGGTAASVFKNYGIAIAAKTGTAELGEGNGSDNVTFIAYAPYDDPQIAVAVVLSHGATGKYSMQVAKDLFDAYFFGKTVDSSGNLVMPSASQQASSAASAG